MRFYNKNSLSISCIYIHNLFILKSFSQFSRRALSRFAVYSIHQYIKKSMEGIIRSFAIHLLRQYYASKYYTILFFFAVSTMMHLYLFSISLLLDHCSVSFLTTFFYLFFFGYRFTVYTLYLCLYKTWNSKCQPFFYFSSIPLQQTLRR